MRDHLFISYKTEEVEYAEQLRVALEQIGYRVWWDREIQTGRAWHDEIDSQLRSAVCVVVLWSKRSAGSKWVGHEAAHAMARNVYAPVRIENVDIPVPYDQIQAATLIGWDGDTRTSEFPNLLNRIKEVCGAPSGGGDSRDRFTPWPEFVPRPWFWRLGNWLAANSFGVLAIAFALIVILVVSIELNHQLDRIERAAEDIGTSVNDAQVAINRNLFPLSSMAVSYYLRPDWSHERFAPYFAKIQQEKANVTGFGTVICEDDRLLLRETLCSVRIDLFFFTKLDQRPSAVSYGRLMSSGNENLKVIAYNSRNLVSTVRRLKNSDPSHLTSLQETSLDEVELEFFAEDGVLRSLELEVPEQVIDSTSNWWSSDGEIASVHDLLGSVLLIKLDDPSWPPKGARVYDEVTTVADIRELRRTVKLSQLVIRIPNGITMAFDESNLTEYVAGSGVRFYAIQFPATIRELTESTQYDPSKRLEVLDGVP